MKYPVATIARMIGARLARRDRVGSVAKKFAPGTTLAGRYLVDSIVGAGPSGVVHSAFDLAHDRRVAIKVMSPLVAVDRVAGALDRMRRAASFDHDHVARIFDAGRLPSGAPFVVRELVRGRSLGDWLAVNARPDPAHAVLLALQVCGGLEHAHDMGFVHGAIKPTNLIFDERSRRTRIELVDFCFAGIDVTNRPFYLSPEQASGSSDVDERTDIWAMGVMLYEMLTGTLPFEGESCAETLARILGEPPTPAIRALRPEIDRGLEAVVLRCLEKDPIRRFPDTRSLARALELHSALWARYSGVILTTDDHISLPPGSSRVA